jgi:hypothetical protein
MITKEYYKSSSNTKTVFNLRFQRNTIRTYCNNDFKGIVCVFLTFFDVETKQMGRDHASHQNNLFPTNFTL